MTTINEKVNEIIEDVNKLFAEVGLLEKGEVYGCKTAIETRFADRVALELILAGYSVKHEINVMYNEGSEYPSEIHELTIYKLGA